MIVTSDLLRDHESSNSSLLENSHFPPDQQALWSAGPTTATSLEFDNVTTTVDPNYLPPYLSEMSTTSRNCVIAYVFLFLLSAKGNFSVFVSVLRQLRKSKSRICLLILHLSIADLMVTLFVMPIEIFWRLTVGWYGGNVMCKICQFLRAFGLYLSSMVLICISLDRYFAIIHPLRTSGAKRRGRTMLGCAWVVSALCSLPQVSGSVGILRCF